MNPIFGLGSHPVAAAVIPEGGPWTQKGPYWSDANYQADLERYTAEIARLTGCPNIRPFCAAQSREETGYGQLFSTINNYANVGNVDSDPKAGGAFASPEAAAQAWVSFIWNGSPTNTYAPFINAAESGETDVFYLASLIKAGGWATDPTYAQDVANKV